jgi:hypothetical protein
MTSKQPQKKGHSSAASSKHATHTAELDRMNSKLERLGAQRKALRKAINQFGEDFDAKTWSDAFDSSDADDINRVFMVTGGYLALVNNTAEAIKTGSELIGLQPKPSLGLSGILDAIRVDGGFTDQQAKTFIELYRTRNRLQHASPDMQADELHTQVRLLLNHLPRFVKSYIAWLAMHGIQV